MVFFSKRVSAFLLVLLLPISLFAIEYQKEFIYDSTVFADEAAANVSIRCNRIPFCYTLHDCIQDIFRIEGAQTENQKALALWKWVNLGLFVGGAGGNPVEGGEMIHDPSKLLNVYGFGPCDGVSWTIAGLWRAAGYVAYNECHTGHTVFALRFRDADGNFRMHGGDASATKVLYWNSVQNRMSPRTIPVMKSMIYRHMTASQNTHSLRKGLKLGETLTRCWTNNGHLSDPDATQGNIFPGEEQQFLEVDTAAATYQKSLSGGSVNTAKSDPAPGSAVLHPAQAGQVCDFVYRIASAYPAAACSVRVVLVKTDASDICKVMMSRDQGAHWAKVYEKTTLGEETTQVVVNQIEQLYGFLLKAEFQTSGNPAQTGMNAMTVKVYRQLNALSLPRLLSGDNYLKVNVDSIPSGYGIRVQVDYYSKYKDWTVVDSFNQFPSYFKINIASIYNATMKSMQLKLVPFSGTKDRNDSMEAMFHLPCTLAGTVQASISNVPLESNIRQVSGFFPQDTVRIDGPVPSSYLENTFGGSDVRTKWLYASQIGAYRAAIDTLLYALQTADGDLATFLMNSIAQIADPKSLPVLLNYWQNAPYGISGPVLRYVPDALARVGDSTIVPALVDKLPLCRFDFRLHIARALGLLGGSVALSALQDMAVNDPFPAVREMAQESWNRLTSGEKLVYRNGRGSILLFNYPNPFNPVTNVSFEVPWERNEGTGIKLGVYNPAGSLVKSLFSGEKAPGTYTIQWNGKDNGNKPVSSGVYVFRMETQNKILEKKAILTK